MLSIQILLFALIPLVAGWLPALQKDGGKIRGVNLGGLFIIEPWMMTSEWQAMGCGAYNSEFDCVAGLGQKQANKVFRKHWKTWITKADFQQMKSYGINTVRIPLGYWMKEDLVYKDSEHFATGSFKYLQIVVQWAKEMGIYVILDLHGAPGAQTPNNAFTGQDASNAGFYVDYQYERAYKFLNWITNITHTNPSFSNVFAIELLNEPLAWSPEVTGSLTTSFYPTAAAQIRLIEQELGISQNRQVHITMMNEAWGAGNPTAHIQDTTNILLDDHHYVKWDSSVDTTCKAYLTHSCTNSRLQAGCTIPQITGEFSLSVADDVQFVGEFAISPLSSTTKQWYASWFAAQMQQYEKGQGWIYWSWKITLNDFRWSYQGGVAAGVIPKNLNTIKAMNVCLGPYKPKRELELKVEKEIQLEASNSTRKAHKHSQGVHHVHHHARNFAIEKI